jgi:uncharacterized BrkB/YihY/UPF0761 family membrane protein
VAGVAVVESPTLWILAEAVTSVAVLTGVLAAMFRIVPHTEVKWGDVLGGALVTAVLFTGTKRLLAWYLGHLGSYAAYGAVGGFLGLLTWIYLASLFLFYGAEFTRVYAEKYGSLAGTSAGAAASVAVEGAPEELCAVAVSEPENDAYMTCAGSAKPRGSYPERDDRRLSHSRIARERTH